MNKDQVDGAIKQVAGSAKEMVGKITGDTKLKAEGKIDKMEGKAQSAIGKVKDKLKD